MGLSVRVLSLDVTRAGLLSRPEFERRDGYEIVFLPVATRLISRGTTFTGALPPSLPGIFHLIREMRTGDWDAAHLHGVPMLTVDLGAFFAALRHRPFLLTVHGVVQAPQRFGGLLAGIYRAWFRWERWLYAHARALTAVSRAMLEECRSLGLVSPVMAVVRVTPHPRPPSTDRPGEVAWLSRHGLTAGSYVACVGNLIHRKGQDLLLEAVGQLSRETGQFRDLKVAFAGADLGTGFRNELGARAESLGIQDRVVFLGRVTDAEKGVLYRYCRCAAVPTRYEASPMVAFEALELGLPLVASDIACLKELLRDEDSALLFSSGDPGALANALRRVWSDRILADRIREGARRTAATFPTWTSLAQEYLQLLFDGPSAP